MTGPGGETAAGGAGGAGGSAAEDLELARACVAGVAGAFDALVERHRRVVHHAIRSALERSGAQDDRDLCDEAFVRVFAAMTHDGMRALRGFEGRSRLGTFLAVVARRVALRTLADLRPRGQAALPGDGGGGPGEPLDPRPDPASRAEGEEARAIVRDAIAALSPRDALAVRLFYEEGLSHREIGTVLGVPVTHVGQILSRARDKLKVHLQRAGMVDDPRDLS